MALSSGEAFALLQKASQHDRLAHACLITGPVGSGKRALAAQLAALIVGGGGDPLQHQDVHTVQPESKSRRILIEQIRHLEGELRMRSMTGGAKVGIIFDADRLQPQAANAFLKTLEEPPGRSHLILLSALPDQLLETIISRCMEIALRPLVAPERSPRQLALLEVLAASHRRPAVELPQVYALVRDFQQLLSESKETAQEQAEAEFKVEEQRYKQSADPRWLEEREEQFKAVAEARYIAERSQLLETLELWWADILRHQAGAAQVEFPSHAAATSSLAAALSPAAALRRSAAIEQLREHLGNSGLQEQLAIEVAFAPLIRAGLTFLFSHCGHPLSHFPLAVGLPANANLYLVAMVLSAAVAGVLIVFNLLSLKHRSTNRWSVAAVVCLLLGIMMSNVSLGSQYEASAIDPFASALGIVGMVLGVLSLLAALIGLLQVLVTRRFRRGLKRSIFTLLFGLLFLGGCLYAHHLRLHPSAPTVPKSKVEYLSEDLTDPRPHPAVSPGPAAPVVVPAPARATPTPIPEATPRRGLLPNVISPTNE